MTCILIDDDLDDQEFFSMALSSINHSYRCLFYNDGVEAIRKMKQSTETPDLIFLDMRMPKMSGAETIRELKKIERLKEVPTILYSTSDPDIGNQEARDAGADRFFTKATSIPELASILDEIIRDLS